MFPVQITTKDMSVSPTLEITLREKAQKLQRLYNRIINCHVMIESPQKRGKRCSMYAIHIIVKVPGKEIVVNKKKNHDVYLAMQEAFNAIERRLEEHSRKRHGRVKTHTEEHHGYVVRLISDEGYGFIRDDEGNDHYFSLTNISNTEFSKLSVGDEVMFIQRLMNSGFHAHHVVKQF